MDGQQTSSAADELRAAVDTLMSVELAAMSSAEVTTLLVDLETQRRRLDAVDQRMLAEIGERGVAGEYARTSTPDLLITLLRVTPREAKARVERAQDLGPRRAITGEPLEPLFPAVANAGQRGELSAHHADVITDCLEHVSRVQPPHAVSVAEDLLVEAARHEHPKQLARTAALLLARLDPDGAEPREDEANRRRAFTLAKRPDGSAIPRGDWTAELVAAWEAIFGALAAPVPDEDGSDKRTPAQRRHDAMAEAARRLLRSDSLPPAGGAPVTILARTTMNELAAGVGVAVTGSGATLSVAQLLQLSADARVVPVICNDVGGVLAYGRERRLASRGQRLALAARDGGCSFPGCDRPAAWAEVHHIRAWIDGGTTDLDNMCLVCRYHHHHFEKLGWDVVMIDGAPHWIPPAWLDPERRPRRNRAQHLTDFDFGNVA